MRYKALLAVTLWVMLFSWTGNLIRHYKVLKLQWTEASSVLTHQAMWLSKEKEIKDRLDLLLKGIDAQKTFDKTKFLGFIDEMARTSFKNFSLDVPQTRSGDVFDSHSIKLKVENAALSELIDFEKIIAEKHPYLSIEELKIASNSNNPHKLNAQYSIIAIQLKKLSNVQQPIQKVSCFLKKNEFLEVSAFLFSPKERFLVNQFLSSTCPLSILTQLEQAFVLL